MRFSATMRKISSRSALLVGFLPTTACFRESHFQYSSNPARCQRTTVSGWTRAKAAAIPATAAAMRARTIGRIGPTEIEDSDEPTPRAAAEGRDSPKGGRGEIEKERAKSKNNSLRALCMPRL